MFRRRKETPALPASKTEDEAEALIGLSEAMRANDVEAGKRLLAQLRQEIAAKSSAAAALEAWLEVEEPKGGVVIALEAVAAE